MKTPHAQSTVTVRELTQRLSSTRRGARLARHLAVQQLDAWGAPYGCELSDAAALVVAELAANAVLHGRVPGRDFLLRLSCGTDVIRIEVADARGESLPQLPPSAPLEADADTGRGLLLVDTVATCWGVDTEPRPGKRIWAELGRER